MRGITLLDLAINEGLYKFLENKAENNGGKFESKGPNLFETN